MISTLELEEAKRIVGVAVTNGLHWKYSSYSDEEVVTLFDNFKKGVEEGDGLRGAWLLTNLSHPWLDERNLFEATRLFAAQDLTGFLGLLEATEFQWAYDLAYTPLQCTDFETCCEWIIRTRCPQLLAVALILAVRKIRDLKPPQSWIAQLTEALRQRDPSQCAALWWQLASLAHIQDRFFAEVIDTICETAVAEIAAAAAAVPSAAHAPRILLASCPSLHALLAEIADRTGETRPIAEQIVNDFKLRLMQPRADLPSLTDITGHSKYLPACGWAIAQLSPVATDAWWHRELHERQPSYPNWRSDRVNEQRCALVLIAACYAVDSLRLKQPELARALHTRICGYTDAWLERWLWFHDWTRKPAHWLALKVIAHELSFGNAECNFERVTHLLSELRDSSTAQATVTRIEQTGLWPMSNIEKLRSIVAER